MILKPKYEKIRKELICLNKKGMSDKDKPYNSLIETNALMIAQSLQLLEESSVESTEE